MTAGGVMQPASATRLHLNLSRRQNLRLPQLRNVMLRAICSPRLRASLCVCACEFPLALANCNKNNWKTFNFSLLKLLHMELAALLLLCFLILRSQGHNWQIDRHESLYPICTIPYTLSKYM